MSSRWFETVAVAQRRARKQLPKSVYWSIVAGSEQGGIDSALLGLGKASIGDLAPDDIVVPPGFTRTLGGDGSVFDPAGSRQATTG